MVCSACQTVRIHYVAIAVPIVTLTYCASWHSLRVYSYFQVYTWRIKRAKLLYVSYMCSNKVAASRRRKVLLIETSVHGPNYLDKHVYRSIIHFLSFLSKWYNFIKLPTTLQYKYVCTYVWDIIKISDKQHICR